MKRLHTQSIAIACCLTAVAAAAALSSPAAPVDSKALTPVDRKHLLGDPFQTFYASRAIPASVKIAYAASLGGEATSTSAGEPKFPMAEPGRPWNATDAVRDPALPFRRLIFVAVSKRYCLIAYERGGVAYSRNASLYYIAGKQAQLRWSGSVFGNCRTLRDVRLAVRAKKYYGADRP